jgi:hypothetical protein
MPKYKITTDLGFNFTFNASDPLAAQNEFICKCIDDVIQNPEIAYGEIIDIRELKDRGNEKND